MQLHIDTNVPLSALDASILRAVLDNVTIDFPTASERQETAKPAPAPRAAAAATRTADKVKAAQAAEKAAAAKKAAEEAEAEEAEAEADEDEPAEDLIGSEGPTLEDALAKATELMANGKASAVKAALAKTGEKRVSALTGNAIAVFMDALAS